MVRVQALLHGPALSIFANIAEYAVCPQRVLRVEERIRSMTLVGEHGFSWPRNAKNLAQIKRLLQRKKGVYVLSHGAMPMYVGKGKIASRVRGHAKKGSTKSKYWDHFSWFVINGGF